MGAVTAAIIGSVIAAGANAAVSNDQSKKAAGQEGQRRTRQNALESQRRRTSTNRVAAQREAQAQSTKVAQSAGLQGANQLLNLKGIQERGPSGPTGFAGVTQNVLQESAV